MIVGLKVEVVVVLAVATVGVEVVVDVEVGVEESEVKGVETVEAVVIFVIRGSRSSGSSRRSS